MTLNMPSIDVAPWSSSSQSTLVYMEVLAKCATPILVSVNSSDYANIEIIGNFCLQFVYLVIKVMRVTIFNSVLQSIHLFQQCLLVLLLEIGVIKYFLQSYNDKEGFFFIAFLVIQCYAVYFARKSRDTSSLEKLKETGCSLNAKTENECESVMHQMIERA